MTVGQTATFSVSAVSAGMLTFQWQKNGQPISGATAGSYTTAPTTSADDASQFQVVVSNSQANVTSTTATLTVQMPPDVVTFHNDNKRTGQNLSETYLTLDNVNATTFGKTGFLATDGKVDGQPLYLANVPIPGLGNRNVLYVVTEHDSAYAFDADNQALLWQATVIGAGETTSDDRQCSEAVTPEIGITPTPVIDRNVAPHGAMYLVSATEDSGGNFHFRLHALDLTTGAELFGGPTEIQAQYPGTGDGTDGVNVNFDPAQYYERAALLLSNGVVYTTWASHCDVQPYTGWILGYDELTLQQTRVLNLTPNGNKGAIWMAADGPAADDAGNIYLLDGNGIFDTTLDSNGFPSNGDFGNAFLKISPTAPTTVLDYFASYDTAAQSVADFDLGSGGLLLFPDLVDGSGNTKHLAVGSGKTGFIYLVDRDNLGKFDPATDNIWQEIPKCCPPTGGLFGPMFSSPAYFNSTVYFGAVGEPIEGFSISQAKLTVPYSLITTTVFPYPGTTPSISANASDNGILWAIEKGATGVLHAYDASSLTEMYSSATNSSRDAFDSGKFIVPTIANGRVYIGTPTGVAIFGLLTATH